MRDKNKKEKSQKKEKKNKEQVQLFIESLHLESLPTSFKFNLACGLLLLILAGIVVAEPLLAYIDQIVISICNMFISIFSERELLQTRDVDIGEDASLCIKFFLGESVACPVFVYLMDGFKNMKE